MTPPFAHDSAPGDPAILARVRAHETTPAPRDDLATLREGIGHFGHAFQWVYDEKGIATSRCNRGECPRCRSDEALSRLEAELARLGRIEEAAQALVALPEVWDDTAEFDALATALHNLEQP